MLAVSGSCMVKLVTDTESKINRELKPKVWVKLLLKLELN